MTFQPKHALYKVNRLPKDFAPFVVYYKQQKKQQTNNKVVDFNLKNQGLDENSLQLFGLDAIHIFYRYIFKTETLCDDDRNLLEALSHLEINHKWSFYTKFLVLQSKSIRDISKGYFQNIIYFQNEILLLWKENSAIIATHSELFIEFAYLYYYQCLIASSVNKQNYNYCIDLLALIEYVNLHKAKIAFIEKYKSLLFLIAETKTMIENTNVVNIKNQVAFVSRNQQKDNNQFFCYYLKAATNFYQGKNQLAKIYTDFISKQVINGYFQIRGYCTAILLMHLCLNSDSKNEQKNQVLLMDLKVMLKEKINHPYYTAFCNLIIELNQSNDITTRKKILEVYYVEFENIENNFSTFHKNLGAFDILKWITLELKR